MVDWSKGAAWMDGDVIPIGEAKIGVTDWGLTRSDITYDVASVWEGGFFRLDDYIERFLASVASLRLDPGMNADGIRDVCHRIVARSGLRHSYVSMVASRGVPAIPGTRDPRTCRNHFYAWCVPYVYVIPPEVAAKGASVWIAKNVRRIPEDSVNPRAKNYHWGDLTQGLFEAKDRDYDSTLLLDHDGNVTEGPGFNAFAVKDNRLITPDLGVLAGITRRTVLEMSAEAGLESETRALPLEEFMEADEIFLCTTGGGITPITRVDERVYCNGTPGPVTNRLRALFDDWRMRPQLRQEIRYIEKGDLASER